MIKTQFISFFEAVKRTKVVRNGRVTWKFISTKPNYKLVHVDGKPKEKRMTPLEIRTRSIASRKAARKKSSKQGRIALKRNRSMKKRTW